VAAVALPVMRKDFLVDPIQVLEARAAGASGVLVIARLLPGGLLLEMTEQALDLGMFVLVEVFDRSDLETAAQVFDRDVLIGVNCRDLATLAVDLERFDTLAPHLPVHLPAVAESGVSSESEVADVVALGYRLALIGSALVIDAEPGVKLQSLLESARSALSAVRP
jgi:indole-3-glycerol phosphate synthase